MAKEHRKNNLIMLDRTKIKIVFSISVISLFLTIDTETTSYSLTQQLKQYRIVEIENTLASTTDSIPEANLGGIVTRVIDGDTIDFKTNDGDTMTIRLALVDAPEVDESGHNEAKDFVSQNCLDKPAIVDPDNNQGLSYGRLVALVYCGYDDLNINEAIILSGLADIYESFCGISEFGHNDWAQNYGCGDGDVDSFNSKVPESADINSDDNQEEISNNCDSACSGVCIPSAPPDLDCSDIPYKNFEVKSPDPHKFDGDANGIGCEK